MTGKSLPIRHGRDKPGHDEKARSGFPATVKTLCRSLRGHSLAPPGELRFAGATIGHDGPTSAHRHQGCKMTERSA